MSGSFRDPSGFVFQRRGLFFRQVNQQYRAIYDRLVASGLDRSLIDSGQLIPHCEVDEPGADTTTCYKILQPDQVPFVSYPYEWCFGQLQAAALRTLEIQGQALEAGLSLKDASAFNIQFIRGRAVLIDTLSFEPYVEGQPWVAYRQFCQHFLAPLALMSYVDPRMVTFFRFHLDGLPLDLTSRLLPWRTRLNPRLMVHLHWHARAQQAYGEGGPVKRPAAFPRRALLGLLDSLRAAVQRLTWEPARTEWANYYAETNYTDAGTRQKIDLVDTFIRDVQPRTVWDLGANTGRFSQVAADAGAETIACDVDPACVEQNYRSVVHRGEPRILPLLMDLSNPSPALGWDHSERDSLLDRGPVDLVMALALVHHLAIARNIPLDRLAWFCRQASPNLIIEFVPKSDSQTQRLLAGRVDVFPGYTRAGFEAAFAAHYQIERVEPIAESDRILYLMRARSA